MSDAIVVGVDGSETALRAATVAARLAAQGGVPLHVVTAYSSDNVDVIRVGSDEYRLSSSEAALNVAAAVAQQVGGDAPKVTWTAREGKPAEALTDEARDVDAALIVVGNRRMQGVGRVLGSVANSVAHHAPCDVYIVKTV